MSKIMWFCIPAWGHTNPTIEVVRELVKRGHEIHYYSFETFRSKIEETGAVYIPCDEYLPKLDEKAEKRLRKSSTTEMTINAFETTKLMNSMLEKEVKSFNPDIIVSDSVCFWGKLTAKKFNIPFVCSTTTFAFNQYSSRYMKNSLGEIADMIFGMGRVGKVLKSLEPLGYHVSNPLEIVQNTNDTNTLVYTSPLFQPFSDTFDSAHYCFMGPSVKQAEIKRTTDQRKLVYISLGTVVNEHPDFYKNCIAALKELDTDVIISCGSYVNPETLGKLPENISVKQHVEQMEVLSRANLFVTHCGMNSASEGLYMGVPELCFPQTGEQQAVARRVVEMNAGTYLSKEAAKNPKKLKEAIFLALYDDKLLEGARKMREDFLSCCGAKGAAEFIEKVC